MLASGGLCVYNVCGTYTKIIKPYVSLGNCETRTNIKGENDEG